MQHTHTHTQHTHHTTHNTHQHRDTNNPQLNVQKLKKKTTNQQTTQTIQNKFCQRQPPQKINNEDEIKTTVPVYFPDPNPMTTQQTILTTSTIPKSNGC